MLGVSAESLTTGRQAVPVVNADGSVTMAVPASAQVFAVATRNADGSVTLSEATGEANAKKTVSKPTTKAKVVWDDK